MDSTRIASGSPLVPGFGISSHKPAVCQRMQVLGIVPWEPVGRWEAPIPTSHSISLSAVDSRLTAVG